MERRRPESISLPPMRNIFDHNGSTVGNSTRGAGDVWCSTSSNTGIISRHDLPSPDRVPRINSQHHPVTPPSQRSGKTFHQYPSPFSENLEDTEMAERAPYYFGTSTTPLFTNDEQNHIPERRHSAVEMQRHPAPATPKEVPLTPSIVHYRPEGVPAPRAAGKRSIQKSGNKKSNELKVRMVKWDRLTGKGTAPLNIEPRSSTPRACTLCHFTRRKVPSSPSAPSLLFLPYLQQSCRGPELTVVRTHRRRPPKRNPALRSLPKTQFRLPIYPSLATPRKQRPSALNRKSETTN